MASASLPAAGHGGRRKSLDAEINLVPFIDLLSMCICFLLMTAVWLEIRALQVKQSIGTESSAAASAKYEVGLIFKSPTSAELQLKDSKGRVAKKTALTGVDIAGFRSNLDEAVKTWILALGVNPEADVARQVDARISAAHVTPHASVKYGELVGTMDVLRKYGIKNLGVNPTR